MSLEEPTDSGGCVKKADARFPGAPNGDHKCQKLFGMISAAGAEVMEGKARWEFQFFWILFCISRFQRLISGLFFFYMRLSFCHLFCGAMVSTVWKKYPKNPVSYCYCVILSLKKKNNDPFSLALYTFFLQRKYKMVCMVCGFYFSCLFLLGIL